MIDDSKRHLDSIERQIDQEEKRLNTRSIRASANRIRNKEQAKVFEREAAKAEHEYNIFRSAELEFDRDPITEVPNEVIVPTYYFEEVAHKKEYNEKYADHYMHRFEDTNMERYRTAAERILNCHRSWFGDHYKQSGVFNVKRVFHCHNRWCWLCSHLKQAKRLYKFYTLIDKLQKDYDLYHIVFTVKNVKGEELKERLYKMQDSIKKIIRDFQGFKKIAGIDFIQYGLPGALRSFEIVINPTDYHPHLHCLFAMKKGLVFPGYNINKFSFNKNNPGHKRPFSDFEIMLQKMFYLAVNGKRINMKNLNDLKLGYSCTVDLAEGDSWFEVFKYATKMSKDGASACTYEQFVLLDDIFFRMKMIQGYGIFRNIDDIEDEKDPTAEILFEKILIMLNRKEKPERDVRFELEKLNDELHRNNLTVISKKMSFMYMQAVMEDLRSDLMIEDGFEPF